MNLKEEESERLGDLRTVFKEWLKMAFSSDETAGSV